MSNSNIPIRPTTRTLHLCSAQQVFDFVVKSVLRQGRPAMSLQQWKDGNGNSSTRTLCEYETSDGLRCAVGFLIPDECNPHFIQGSLSQWTRERFAKVGWRNEGCDDDPETAPAHYALLVGLQRCHDEAATGLGDFITGFVLMARDVASRHGLDMHALLPAERGSHEAVVYRRVPVGAVGLYGADVQQPQPHIEAKPGVCVPVFS